MHRTVERDWFADSQVVRVSGTGPQIGRARQVRHLRRYTFIWALSRRDRVTVAGLSLGWLACLSWFWVWWLQPGHLQSTFGLVANSAVLAYVSVFPVYFIIAANRLRRIAPEVPVVPLRVAFVVTRAPSEPFSLVRNTLAAMLAQDYPHDFDVWLCDEQPSAESASWCASHNVRMSSRWQVDRYHRQTWPRRTRCKEGNLAYFYDTAGYQDYDVVAQLDCDHVPRPDYLAEMVRAFADPAIGYVAAPSVCDANAGHSWAARGRLYREATFHGPHQLGHNGGLGPVCIGSHYAVRTSALREIGGIGPELAEDFSTTFLLTSAGWHGAFAIDAEAHGDGPNTFAAMVVQEFQWARSLTTLLLTIVPRNIRLLRWPLRLRFSYALSYYLLVVSTTAAGLCLGPIAAISGQPWIDVNYAAFLGHWWAISAWVLMLVLLLRRRGLLRPPDAPIVSWETWLYALTRWPFIGLGIAAAVLNLVRRRHLTLRVTPKGRNGLEPLSARLVLPFFVISAVSAAAALAGERGSHAPGYVFLSALAGLTYAIVTAAIPLLHAREAAVAAGTSLRTAIARTVTGPMILAGLALALAVAAAALYPAYVMRMFGW